MHDEPGIIIAIQYNRDICQMTQTNEQYLEGLMNVTKEEIIEVANKVKLDTVYLLTGKETL